MTAALWKTRSGEPPGRAGPGRDSPPYDEWDEEDLYEKAEEVGVEGRSDMTKDELIDALRNH